MVDFMLLSFLISYYSVGIAPLIPLGLIRIIMLVVLMIFVFIARIVLRRAATTCREKHNK